MLRKVIIVALTTLTLLLGSNAAASAYTPPPGAMFNNPYGGADTQNRLAAHIRQSIASTPRNSVIRIAVYSFDRRDIGDALAAACRRRVTVQIVINDNWISHQVRRMKRLLGSKINPHYGDACHPRTKGKAKRPYQEPSFIKVCFRACRIAGPGNQHMKIYMFSQAGSASNVIMFGSNNLATYAARTHWNDLFTVRGRPAMFNGYSAIFRQLAEDKRVDKPYVVQTNGGMVTEFGPKRNVGPRTDPVSQRLAAVGCRATGGTGASGHTVIRISMYAWVGDRGRYLARRVGKLSREGCRIRAILSHPAKDVKKILRNNGVKIRSADMNTDDDKETGFGETAWEHFTHEKWMSLSGTFRGKPTRSVWTGSENWSNRSFHNDEVVVRIPRRNAHNAYARHFDMLWNSSVYTRPL